MKWLVLVASLLVVGAMLPNQQFGVVADEDDTAAVDDDEVEIDDNGGASDESGTDSDAVEREAKKMTIDGMSPEEYATLRDSGEKHEFQAEVSRMMK